MTTRLRGARLIAVAALCGLLPAAAALAAPANYERLVGSAPASERERQLLAEVRGWSRQRGKRLRYDARLGRAAAVLLPSAPKRPGEPIDLAAARRAAQRFGCTDGQLAAITLRAPVAADLGPLLAAQLSAELADREINRFGLAARPNGDGVVVVALFSRHLVNLLPFPSRLAAPRRITIEGSLAAGIEAEALELVIGRATGKTDKRPLARRGRSFAGELELSTGDRGARLDAQVLIDRGRGPEIAATFVIGVGVEAWPASAGGPELPAIDASQDPEIQLANLILGLRASQDLDLPAQSGQLCAVARAHALDMRDHHFFAHTSPATGDVTDRLKGRGIRFVRALENLATAESALDTMESWLQSPSHRANLLDPEITAFGIGVVKAEPDGPLFSVAVLARLPTDGTAAELAAEAERYVNRLRARRGRAPLKPDRRLRHLASRHSAEIAGAGRLGEVSPVRGHLLDTVFREADVSEVAVDVYLADSIDAVIDVVGRSLHVSGRYTQVGVGLHRQPAAEGAKLWVTVIYAAR